MSELSAAAAALGRKGGKTKSESKSAAARENGKKGGRPSAQARILKWWRLGKNVWEISQITGIDEQVVMKILHDN